MKTNIELLKDVLLNHQPINQSMMTEEQFNDFVRNDLHIPFIKAMDDAVNQYKNDTTVQTKPTGEDIFREKLNESKMVK